MSEIIIRSPLSDVNLHKDLSLPRYILGAAQQFADKVALVDGVTERSYTYRQLIDKVRRLGSALCRRGVKKDDVILIFCPNVLEYAIILHATNYIGAVLTTCNPLYTSGELYNQLEDSQTSYLITIPEHVPKVREAAARYGKVKEIITVAGAVPGCVALETLLADDGSFFHEATFDPCDQMAILPYSSGTTGKSKGVILTHNNMVSMVSQISHPEVNVMRPGEEVLVCILPCFHIYAICVYLTWALRNGARIILFSRFELQSYLRAIEKHRATFLHMVPPIALMLAKHPDVDAFDTSSVHTVICGAAPFGKEQAEELMARLNIKAVRQGYGLTETSAVTHVAPIDGWKHGSVGVLLPNMECKVLDTATRETLGPDRDGELCFRGPTNMKGYLNRPEATANTLDPQGWLHSGDIGHYDTDGHFFIVDRVKELIKYKGFQVPPAELESVILTHGDVADVAVVGVPSPEAGELPRAYVVLKPGCHASHQQIKHHVADRLASYKRLRGGVEFVEAIPKSASGKILRRQLKQRAAKLVTSRL